MSKQHFDLFTFVARAHVLRRRCDRRATSRAASWKLRAILRIGVFGQHLAFIGHVAQAVCRDLKMMVLALVINAAQKVIGWDVIFKVERVKQSLLPTR